MAGIIDSLKARRARNAAMLNPGKRPGSGSGLLLKSSSLQPQTIFRQTKASFSVKRPSMTLLNLNSMSSFSKQAESKYSDTQSLMHLRPSSVGGAATVQRAPAPMPLPRIDFMSWQRRGGWRLWGAREGTHGQPHGCQTKRANVCMSKF